MGRSHHLPICFIPPLLIRFNGPHGSPVSQHDMGVSYDPAQCSSLMKAANQSFPLHNCRYIIFDLYFDLYFDLN